MPHAVGAAAIRVWTGRMTMATVRIIQRLDIKGPNVVEGVRFESFRVPGRPEPLVGWNGERGADELICQDAVASLHGRNSLHEVVERTAKELQATQEVRNRHPPREAGVALVRRADGEVPPRDFQDVMDCSR